MKKSPGQMERERLFDTFSKNLSLVNQNYTDLFACPICCEGFTKAQIDSVNLAHTWPESLGGTRKTLTCVECNSRVGRLLEGDTGKYARYMASEKFRVSIVLPDIQGRLSADVWKESGKLDFIKKFSNPKPYERIQDFSVKELSMIITPHLNVQYDLKNVELTYLHFAYLHLFHNFGYEFIFTPLGRLVRQQLTNPEQSIFNNSVSYVLQSKLSGPLREKAPYHYVIYKPSDMIGFAVISPELDFLPNHRALIKFFVGSKFNNNDRTEGEFNLIRLLNSHDLLSSEYAPHASRFILFTVLIDQGIVNSNEEASEMVKNAYIHTN